VRQSFGFFTRLGDADPGMRAVHDVEENRVSLRRRRVPVVGEDPLRLPVVPLDDDRGPFAQLLRLPAGDTLDQYIAHPPGPPEKVLERRLLDILAPGEMLTEDVAED